MICKTVSLLVLCIDSSKCFDHFSYWTLPTHHLLTSSLSLPTFPAFFKYCHWVELGSDQGFSCPLNIYNCGFNKIFPENLASATIHIQSDSKAIECATWSHKIRTSVQFLCDTILCTLLHVLPQFQREMSTEWC